MVYMILYSDGKAGYVMDEEGKKNLKKIFDEMNYIDKESSYRGTILRILISDVISFILHLHNLLIKLHIVGTQHGSRIIIPCIRQRKEYG